MGQYGSVELHTLVYLKNAAAFSLPSVAIYLIWKRSLSLSFVLVAAAAFAAGALLVNLYPSRAPHHTAGLIAVHLPIALLVNLLPLAIGYARFLAGRLRFQAIVDLQMRYLPAYAVWAAFVVTAFPPIFAFIWRRPFSHHERYGFRQRYGFREYYFCRRRRNEIITTSDCAISAFVEDRPARRLLPQGTQDGTLLFGHTGPRKTRQHGPRSLVSRHC